MRDWYCSRLAVLILSLFVFIGSAWSDNFGTNEQTRLSGVIYLGDVPTLVADHKGLFKQHRLDVAVEYNQSGQANLRQLRAGETDFALMALTPIVIDRLADPTPGEPDDLVILASLVHSIQLNHVLGRADSDIETPADLQGRRVAVQKGTNAEFVWWLFTHIHGIDAASVELVDRPVSQIPDGLINGEFDAGVIWEPWSSLLEDRLGIQVRAFTGSNVYTAKWVLVTNRRFLSRHPDRVQAVLSSYYDAIEFIESSPEQAIHLFSEHADVSPEILRSNWQALDYDLNLDWTLVATLLQQVDWARKAGYPEAGTTSKILDLIDPAPLRALYPRAVGIPAVSSARASPP